MNDALFSIILMIIPVVGVIITSFIIPWVKGKIGIDKIDLIAFWVAKAVQCAEVIFDAPKSGEEKKFYVINFIDRMFNSKKEVITKEQIEILLEAAWKEMTGK